MAREAWTDERLDDLSARVDAGFERIDRDLRDFRAKLSSEIGGLRTDLGRQIEALRHTMLQVGGGMLVALLGVIAAIFANGA